MPDRFQSLRILGVTPARGGSKGIPRKNIKELYGAPLIAWTIRSALNSKLITDYCVTTDDPEIRDVALSYGAAVPFLRPKELAQDRSLAVPTIQHAVKEMETLKKVKYDIIIMLQPTSPMKGAEHIDEALTKLITDDEATGIISVVDVDNFHPMKMKKFLGTDRKSGQMVDYEKPPKECPPRQELPPVFMVNGAIYATKRDVFMNENTFQGKKCLGYIMPPERSVNIDSEADFVLAEYYLKRQGEAAPKLVSFQDSQKVL